MPTYPRHPAALAQQALTASAALGGRLTLGIGPSHKVVIEDMFGYSFSRPLRHTREYLQVLVPLLDRRPVSFQGETVRADIGLTTPGSGRVPVLLAALGPGMLRLAAEQTDGTVLWMTGPATVRDHIVPVITAGAAALRPARLSSHTLEDAVQVSPRAHSRVHSEDTRVPEPSGLAQSGDERLLCQADHLLHDLMPRVVRTGLLAQLVVVKVEEVLV